jgi:transcriptional regulator with XRE-family HTH domain
MKAPVTAASLSSDLVWYLRHQQGKTLRQIGEMIAVSESYVSRVANGERNFTIEHLVMFERMLGQPLPILLLEAVWKGRVPAESRGVFEKGVELLREGASLEQALARPARTVGGGGHVVKKVRRVKKSA